MPECGNFVIDGVVHHNSGKSAAMAAWCVATAAGLDAYAPTVGYWVRRWVEGNGLDPAGFPRQPGPVWFASPTWEAAVDQIQPHLQGLCPEGTVFRNWGNKQGGGEALLPNGGRLLGRSYKQYQDNMTRQAWEGSAIQGLGFDEEPASAANLTAGLSRLVDRKGRAVLALTPLNGENWLYEEYVKAPPAWIRIDYLDGADNPHIPQDWRELMLSSVPEWQRASRARGAFTVAEGRVFAAYRYPLDQLPAPGEELPGAPWRFGVGIDWGETAGHTAAVLVAYRLGPHGLPEVRVLGEYVSTKVTTTADDARAIVDLLASIGLDLDDPRLDLWVGDTNTLGKAAPGQRVNEALERELRLLALNAGAFLPEGFHVGGADKRAGAPEAGWRHLGEGFGRGLIRVDASRCPHLDRALRRWEGADDEHKHVLDAFRYVTYRHLGRYLGERGREERELRLY